MSAAFVSYQRVPNTRRQTPALRSLSSKFLQGSYEPAAGACQGKAHRDLVPEPVLAKAGNEARIGQKGTLTRLWARKGTRPRALRDSRYEWAYLFGAVCPDRAVGAGIVMPCANTEAMNGHLKDIGKAVSPGAHAAIMLDGAGWHGSRELAPPENITLITLPPYSPELDPVENVWEYLRKNKLVNRLYETYEDIADACCEAWNSLMAKPEQIASIASREWAKVS